MFEFPVANYIKDNRPSSVNKTVTGRWSFIAEQIGETKQLFYCEESFEFNKSKDGYASGLRYFNRNQDRLNRKDCDKIGGRFGLQYSLGGVRFGQDFSQTKG